MAASSTGTLLNGAEMERLQERLMRKSVISVPGNGAASLRMSDLYSEGGRGGASPNLLFDSRGHSRATPKAVRGYSALPATRPPSHHDQTEDEERKNIGRLQGRISTLEDMLQKAHEKLEAVTNSLVKNYHNAASNPSPALSAANAAASITPDVFVLQRRIDEQNARIASLEKALKVKESSIVHLSMSLENQLDTLHSYQEEMTKMKFNISSLTERNRQLGTQHETDRDLADRYERLERDHLELKHQYESKVTSLSEQTIMLQERWQSCQSDLATEKQRHEETRIKLEHLLEGQMANVMVGGKDLLGASASTNNEGRREDSRHQMQMKMQQNQVDDDLKNDFNQRLERLEHLIFQFISPLAQNHRQSLISSDKTTEPKPQESRNEESKSHSSKSSPSTNSNNVNSNNNNPVLFLKLRNQVRALKAEVANLQLVQQGVQTSPSNQAPLTGNEKDSAEEKEFRMIFEREMNDLRKILSAQELDNSNESSSNNSTNFGPKTSSAVPSQYLQRNTASDSVKSPALSDPTDPLQSTVLLQRRATLEGELLQSYAEFREREEQHHKLLQQKESELAETERQLQMLKAGEQ